MFFLFVFLSSHVQAEHLSHKQLVHLFNQNQLVERNILEADIDEVALFQALKSLEKVAKSVSRSWPSNILSGPYAQLSPAYLNKKSVKALYLNNEIVAFYAEAIADAAYTNACELNEKLSEIDAAKELNSCLKKYRGVIFESFLMSADGLYVSRYKEPADFDL